MYLQGLSSSLPEDVQKAVVRSIRGLERAVFMRTAYAIEYDCCDPTQLRPTLEFRDIAGLYGAGQFNGSSGYEEAAAQGLVAGDQRRACGSSGRGEFVLLRSEAYIGALIDDLVTKGTNEPYRDDDLAQRNTGCCCGRTTPTARLTPRGRELGLIDDARWNAFLTEQAAVEAEIARLRAETLPESGARDALLAAHGDERQRAGFARPSCCAGRASRWRSSARWRGASCPTRSSPAAPRSRSSTRAISKSSLPRSRGRAPRSGGASRRTSIIRRFAACAPRRCRS